MISILSFRRRQRTSARHSVARLLILMIPPFAQCLVLAGCAKFHLTEIRTVSGTPIRIGPVADSFVAFNRIEPVRVPDDASSVLQIRLTKRIASTVRYETRTHQEAVYRRQRSKLEHNAVLLVAPVALSLVGDSAKYLPYGIALGALLVASAAVPPPEFRYMPIDNSGRESVSYLKEERSLPAAGEVLVFSGAGAVTTDEHGLAAVAVPRTRYDAGLTIFHDAAKAAFLIRRVRRTRTVNAEWVEPLKAFGLAGEVVESVVGVLRKVSAGAGMGPILLVLVVDAVRGVLFHYLIHLAGRSTQTYADWVIIDRR